MCKYSVIIKTGDAEIRAVEHTTEQIRSQLFPLIEITRGRKVANTDSRPFGERLSKIMEAFRDRHIALDATSDTSLSSTEIDNLYVPTNGYRNWIDFLVKIKKLAVTRDITPSVLLNVEDSSFKENVLEQVRQLKKLHFSSILYRNNIADKGCYDDFHLLRKEFEDLQLFVMIDCGYTPQASHNNFAQKVIDRIRNIKQILSIESNVCFIVSATSFPKNVSDLGDVEKDTFTLSEINMHKQIINDIPGVMYGDYATINPIRNDTVTMARGWIPRIDVPLQEEVYYYKKRRPQGVSAYASTYVQVAKAVTEERRFPKELEDNWGIRQIIACANGGAPASKPSFWMAVRMNIHLEQQAKRLSLDV
jgi:hypothetical protein